MTDTENPYAAAVAALERERAEIDEMIVAMRKRAGLISEAAANPPADSGGWAAPSDKPFAGLVISAAIRKYLEIAKKPRKPVEIASALLAGGIEHKSKNWYGTVLTTLRRTYGVVRTSDGWGLAEWGLPAASKRKKTKRAKRSGRPAKRASFRQPAAAATHDQQIAESRQVQGRYMFWLKKVPADKRETYKMMAKKDGREKAIRAMSRDFGD